MSDTPVTAAYFDAMYAADPDPWQFESRWYEQRKRALTLAALPNRRYRRGFEPGCSIGTLTEQLATRCDHLIATDIAAAALDSARRRTAHLAGTVEIRRWALGQDWPATTFDLIVLSEVCYYLDAPTLRAALDDATHHSEPGATILLAHWRHPVAEYPLTGDDVHALAHSTDGLSPLARYQDADMTIDVFTAHNHPALSVAVNEGLV